MDKRILIFGGSYNPLHLGHLCMAQEIAIKFFYDEVILIPAYSPPHKILEDDPGPQKRFLMIQEAISNLSLFRVDDFEVNNTGISYTVNTLRFIINSRRLALKPGLVIGDDLLSGLHTWKDPHEICALADLIVARRSNDSIQNETPYPCKLAHNSIIPVSSSAIRLRIKNSLPWKHFVPISVARTIEIENLYRA
jgi:nicotinate-nucleotide adenylyltransferase